MESADTNNLDEAAPLVPAASTTSEIEQRILDTTSIFNILAEINNRLTNQDSTISYLASIVHQNQSNSSQYQQFYQHPAQPVMATTFSPTMYTQLQPIIPSSPLEYQQSRYYPHQIINQVQVPTTNASTAVAAQLPTTGGQARPLSQDPPIFPTITQQVPSHAQLHIPAAANPHQHQSISAPNTPPQQSQPASPTPPFTAIFPTHFHPMSPSGNIIQDYIRRFSNTGGPHDRFHRHSPSVAAPPVTQPPAGPLPSPQEVEEFAAAILQFNPVGGEISARFNYAWFNAKGRSPSTHPSHVYLASDYASQVEKYAKYRIQKFDVLHLALKLQKLYKLLQSGHIKDDVNPMVFLAPSLHDKIFSTYKAEHHVDLTDMELIDRFTNHSLWDQHTLYGIGALIHMIILATPVAFDSQAQVMNNLYRITLFNRREDEGLTLSVSTITAYLSTYYQIFSLILDIGKVLHRTAVKKLTVPKLLKAFAHGITGDPSLVPNKFTTFIASHGTSDYESVDDYVHKVISVLESSWTLIDTSSPKLTWGTKNLKTKPLYTTYRRERLNYMDTEWSSPDWLDQDLPSIDADINDTYLASLRHEDSDEDSQQSDTSSTEESPEDNVISSAQQQRHVLRSSNSSDDRNSSNDNIVLTKQIPCWRHFAYELYKEGKGCTSRTCKFSHNHKRDQLIAEYEKHRTAHPTASGRTSKH